LPFHGAHFPMPPGTVFWWIQRVGVSKVLN
jgi:hypothetical protein